MKAVAADNLKNYTDAKEKVENLMATRALYVLFI
jgi:hypothetical protein